MISVIATIELSKGRRDDFLAALRQVVPKVLAEQGCVEYGPWIDLPTNIAAQPAVRENVVTVIEKWDDIEALQTHLMAPHMLEFRENTAAMRVAATLQILASA